MKNVTYRILDAVPDAKLDLKLNVRYFQIKKMLNLLYLATTPFLASRWPRTLLGYDADVAKTLHEAGRQ
jgi:hypothetical protein